MKSEVSFDFLPIKKKGKTPDIVVKSSNRNLIVEVTTKDYSEDYWVAYQNDRKISMWEFSLPREFGYYKKIHRPLLSSGTVEEILSKCEKLRVEVENTGYGEFHIPHTIDYYLFRWGNEERVPKKNRVNRGKYPVTDEYNRLRGTIKDKVKQLNSNSPSILVIIDPMFFPRKLRYFDKKMRLELEETVYRYPNLSAVMIIAQFADTAEDYSNQLIENDRSISMKTYDPKTLFSTYKIVILNKFAKFPLTVGEKGFIKKI
jgi:hypothetical protein